MSSRLLKQCVAEFIGTFALIFIGVGAIYHNAGLLAVAFAHGLTIGVMACAVGAISGGQFNPAVTLGLLVGGKMDLPRSIAYWIAQLAGATVAAFLLLFLFTGQLDPHNGGSLAKTIVANGTPAVAVKGVDAVQAVLIEAVLTFFLMFVIYGTAVDGRGPKPVAGLAIGLTITLDILFGGPFTGAAMNPARVFGPALASDSWGNHWIYWVGPTLGSTLGGLVYGRFLIKEDN